MIARGMLRAALRSALLVSVVLGAMWLLLPSAGGAHPRAHAAQECLRSSVHATVYNDTKMYMSQAGFQYGYSNTVCRNRAPGGVAPGKTGQWLIGDNFFLTEVTVRYLLDNGDGVEWKVIVGPGSPGVLSCGWSRVVSSPRAFDCSASWAVEPAGRGKAKVQLRVFPVGASVSVDPAQARSAAVRRCRHGSVLIGTTTNLTGVPLELVSVSHGPADGWCRAPGRSQAAHSAGRWKLGGPHAGASARITYRLPNGDEVDFAAAVNPRGGAIGCAPLDRARARVFGCRAVTGTPNGESPRIDLQVFPIRAADGSVTPPTPPPGQTGPLALTPARVDLVADEAAVVRGLLGLEDSLTSDAVALRPRRAALARRIRARNQVLIGLCSAIIRDDRRMSLAERELRLARAGRDEFNVEDLFKVIETAIADARKKLEQLRMAGENIGIADMFEMQMLMNRLTQLSEMSTLIASASNSAISEMARNAKG